MNPYFKVEPPLSNETRDTMFRSFIADPVKHTPRALAVAYGIAIARVRAVLRLKALEAKLFSEGKPSQTNLAKNMDILLQSRKVVPVAAGARESEPLRPLENSSQKSFFVLVNETGMKTEKTLIRVQIPLRQRMLLFYCRGSRLPTSKRGWIAVPVVYSHSSHRRIPRDESWTAE
jgi:hypothetical protein